MLVWIFAFLIVRASCQRGHTPFHLVHLDHMDNLAQFGDAEHRGPSWYDYSENDPAGAESSLESDESTDISTSSTDSEAASILTSVGSSEITSERKQATKLYRKCTACPQDMLKKYANIGIKWVCGGYQRARRSFKSECMMRYRNCQDGTMFVKLHDSQCRRDSYHGKHFFYQYTV